MIKPKISVDSGWDPTGESWPTIIQKLVLLNQIDARTYKTILFNALYEKKRITAKHALTAKSFNVSEISRLTNWNSMQLNASFIDILLSFDMALKQTRSIEKVIKISKNIRVCPICFEEGIHLIFHQCIDFEFCPLHFEPLKDTCPDCSRPLQEYLMSVDIALSQVVGYFNCPHCNSGNLGERLGRTSNLQAEKIEIVEQYLKWCQSIQSRQASHKATGRYGNIIWHSNPKSFADIKKLIQLYDCPQWLRRSLLGTNHKELDSYQSTLKRALPENKKEINSTQRTDSLVGLDDARGQFTNSLHKSVVNFEYRLLRTKLGFKLNTDSPKFFRGQEHVTWRFDSKRSVFATAFVILQWAVEDLTDPDKRAELNEFWVQWWNGPAHFSLKDSNKKGVAVTSNELVKEISSIWFDRMLVSLFKTLLFHGAAQGEAGTVPIFHTPSLVSLMKASDCTPMFIVAETNDNLVFHELSVFSDLNTFIRKFSGRLDELPLPDLHSDRTIKLMRSLKKTKCPTLFCNGGWLGYSTYTNKTFKDANYSKPV